MTVFWSLVLLALTVGWSVRVGRWAWSADRAQRKMRAEMGEEVNKLIIQIETGKGPHDPGSGMAGDRA